MVSYHRNWWSWKLSHIYVKQIQKQKFQEQICTTADNMAVIF